MPYLNWGAVGRPAVLRSPYTATGRWFPQEWFNEMGVQPVHPDITDEEIQHEINDYNDLVAHRAEMARLAREEEIRLAEEARLAALAARPPLIDRILTAFEQTLFTAISVPVFRRVGAPAPPAPTLQERLIDPLDVDAMLGFGQTETLPGIADLDADAVEAEEIEIPEEVRAEINRVMGFSLIHPEGANFAWVYEHVVANCGEYTRETLHPMVQHIFGQRMTTHQAQQAPPDTNMEPAMRGMQATLIAIDEAEEIPPFMAPVNPALVDDPEMFRETPGYIQVVNTRTDQVLSIMSDEYEIINDESVLRRAATLLDAAQFNVEPIRHHITIGRDGIAGRTTFAELELPDITIVDAIPGGANVRIVISNSFDGSKKERLHIVLRSIATGNYIPSFMQREEFAIRHRSGANDRLSTELAAFVTHSVEYNTRVISYMRDTAVPGNNATDLVGAYIQENRILTGERNVETIFGRWMVAGTPTNLWEVYSIFASAITHEYGNNFSAKLTKLSQLNNDVHRVWPTRFNITLP